MKDRLDTFLWGLLLVSVAGLCGVFWMAPSGAGSNRAHSVDKAMEREMAYQARVAFLQRLYVPVTELSEAGRPQEALLKLDELIRRYPGEAHGLILQGELLNALGSLDRAIESFVKGVRLNGDYVDEKSPLSRRAEIRQLVDRGLRDFRPRAQANPGNQSLAATLNAVYYLQGRLAGGCE